MYSTDFVVLHAFMDTLVNWDNESEFVMEFYKFIALLGYVSEALDKFSIDYQTNDYNNTMA